MTVSAWEDRVKIKTYLLGPDDPNPPWQKVGMGRISPYPMQDNLSETAEEVAYRALHLENEYLRLTVLPELGGRLYSLYDKGVDREVFYRNNVVKYGLVARRGAWISGGIEFNFPQGHTCVTVAPVPSALMQDRETGGASITVGCTDRVSRMTWRVRLSLAPGEARMRQDVMLYNPTPIRQRHYFWANSAVPATDDLRLVYPATRVRTLGGEHSYPLCDRRDLSWYRNHERPNDIFCLNSEEDFFGCYYERRDVGLVHWADCRTDFGKKFFTWGTADEGMIWADLLTDADGQYVEIQSGRFVDQSTFEFLSPYQGAAWTEYWWPLHGMGGFLRANDTAAANLRADRRRIAYAVMVNRSIGRGEVVIEQRGKRIHHTLCHLRAAQPVTGEFATKRGSAAAPIRLALHSAGRAILTCELPPAYRTERALEVTAKPVAPSGPDGPSAQALCLQALRQEKLSDLDQAHALYEKALAQDPASAQAHAGLGVILLQRAQTGEARAHLRQALAADPENDQTAYHLALATLPDEPDVARTILWRLIGRTACRTEAAIALAKMELRAGDFVRARAILAGIPGGPTSSFLRAVIARIAPSGPKDRGQAVSDDPLDAHSAVEKYLAAAQRGPSSPAAKRAATELTRRLNRDPELWLELVSSYLDLNLPQDACAILRLGCKKVRGMADSPMAHYYLAELDPKCAKHELAVAASRRPDYCFPSRTEELSILTWAASHRAAAWRANLYLGNLLAGLGRREEAIRAWQNAAARSDEDAVLCRNLALAHLLWRKDNQTALAWYQKAIRCRPDDYHLHLERDNALVVAGAKAEERLRALDGAPSEVSNRWEIAARRADCLVKLGRWDEAIELLRSHRFRPWEGARQMHALWAQALCGRASVRRQAGDHRGAADDYALALTYPRNLGVGRAAYPEEAKTHWLLAETLAEIGDSHKRRQHLRAAGGERHLRVCEADVYTVKALRALGLNKRAAAVVGKLEGWARDRLKAQPNDPLAREILAL